MQKRITIPSMTSPESDWQPITGLGTPYGGTMPGKGKVRFTDRTVATVDVPRGFRAFLYRWVCG